MPTVLIWDGAMTGSRLSALIRSERAALARPLGVDPTRAGKRSLITTRKREWAGLRPSVSISPGLIALLRSSLWIGRLERQR
jgi:hypothetical protein